LPPQNPTGKNTVMEESTTRRVCRHLGVILAAGRVLVCRCIHPLIFVFFFVFRRRRRHRERILAMVVVFVVHHRFVSTASLIVQHELQ